MVTISEKGLAVIEHYEGFRDKPYLDVAGVPTIGFGTTRYPDGRKVTMSDSPVTEAEARAYLRHHITTQVIPAVTDLVDTYSYMSQDMLDAVLSWTYNLGSGNLRSSTLRKKLRARDWFGAADEFLKWIYAGGQIQNGLRSRRATERHLFLTGEVKFYNE